MRNAPMPQGQVDHRINPGGYVINVGKGAGDGTYKQTLPVGKGVL